MTTSSIFSVTPADLSRLNTEQAVDLVAQLLWAESMRIGLPISNVHISKTITAKDGGIDASIDDDDADEVNFNDTFLSIYRSGFQIKSGTSFSLTEGQIRKELFGDASPAKDALASAVRDCMDDNGTYILVCVGADPADDKVRNGEDLLKRLFNACGYPDPDVQVWGQNQLIGFLKRFPSIALWVNGKAGSLFQTHTSWAAQIEMRRIFKPGEPQTKLISDIQSELRRHVGAAHVRVRGEAGIGKTRLVLESLRADDLMPLVVYCDGPQKFIHGDLLNELVRDDNDYSVIAVVDECDRKSYTSIWNQLGARGPRIKFVSIHNDIDEPSGSTVVIDAPPLDDEQTSAVIRDYGVPSDHAGRWAQYCDGSPRVAHVIGQNLQLHPDDILKQPDSVDLWDRYVAGADDPTSETVRQRRLVLRFIALFKRFGYEEPVVAEAQSIWKLISEADNSITWHRFQEIIKLLRQKKLLQGETTLYISPQFLHIYLWSEWFEHYGLGFEVSTFESKLHSNLVEWFREMFRYARQSQDGMRVVRQILAEDGPFGKSSFFQRRGGAEFFLRLTDAAPELALRRLEQTIGRLSLQQLNEFREGRRQVVWALEKIAVWRQLFGGAARLLLRLAAAENENIGNNATGVFAGLFSPGHGPVAPTEASPEERFPVLVEAVSSSVPEERKVGLLAAKDALTTGHFSRIVGAEYQGLRQPPELWVPKTWGEIFDAYRRVWHLLEGRLDAMEVNEQREAVKTLLQHARGVGEMANLTPMVVESLKNLMTKPYVDRRDLIDVVEDIYRYDSNSFEPDTRALWDELRTLLAPTDFHSRLQRYVGMNRWADLAEKEAGRRGSKIERAIRDLASESYTNSHLLPPELSWLVTEDAKNGFQFGYELGRLDTAVAWLDSLLEAQRGAVHKPSAFFLGGYIRAFAERSPDDSEDLLDRLATDRDLKRIVPELSWRSGLTDRGALRILTLARSSSVDAGTLRMFSFGGAVRRISEPVFLQWLEFLLEVNTQPSVADAVHLLNFYYLMDKTGRPLPRDMIFRALTADPFFTDTAPEDTDVSMEHDWNEVAQAFVNQYPDLSVTLANKMLAHFGEHRSIVGGYRPQTLKVLEQILRHHPEELWNTIENNLGPPLDSRAFQIRHWLRDGAMRLVPATSVWKWVEANVDERAWYLATFVRPTFPGHEESVSARDLLVRYGDREDVRRNLIANFSSEGWWGPESGHYQQKLATLANWRRGENHPNVRRWLDEYITVVESRIERARIEEERKD